MSPQPTPSRRTCTPPWSVMLLSLWAPPAGPWHARLVGTDADVHEFDSPFELARFVARVASAPAPAVSADQARDQASHQARGQARQPPGVR